MIMPSLANKSLLQRETALELDVLFYDEAVAALFKEQWPDVLIQNARARYVRYKPLTSCLVRYDVTTASGVEPFYIKSYNSADKLAKARATTKLPGYRVVLEERNLVLHRFPDDTKLKRLSVFAYEEKRQKLLAKVLPDFAATTFELLTYKPERRLVVKAASGAKQAALKFYTSDTFALAKVKSEMVLKHLRTPNVLGSSERYGVIALEWLGGKLLRDLLAVPGLNMNTLRDVGATLAQLHSQKVALPGHVQDKPGHLHDRHSLRAQQLVEYLSWLQPESSQRFYRLLEYTTSILRPPEKTVMLHGDFYDKQIIVSEKGIAFLDFDEAHYGDAAFDLGLFLAHLEDDVVRGFVSAAALEGLEHAFLHGYVQECGYAPKNLAAFKLVGILSLLPHFFRNCYPNWAELTDALLTRAERLVELERYAIPR